MRTATSISPSPMIANTRILASLLAAAGACKAHAQCSPPAESIPSQFGKYATAYALLPWDPDGPGPEPEGLIAGGDFRFAGEGPVEFVAFWSGAEWHAMGHGLPGPAYALARFNGVPIAGGPVIANGPFATGIAAWDGSEWRSMPGVPALGTIRALLVRNGQLIAAGESQRVAAWDGGTWTVLQGVPFAVRALIDFRGELIAGGGGGEFSYVARWTGAHWVNFGTFDGYWQGDNYVLSLAEYDSALIAAGTFWTANGEPAPGLAAWDGQTWRALAPDLAGAAYAATVHANRLYTAGYFVGTGPILYLLQFDGSRWTKVKGAPTYATRALTDWDGALALGGSFRDGPAQASPGAVTWNGQSWQGLGHGLHAGSGGRILAMAAYDGQLIAAGSFDEVGAEDAENIAAWDGARWRPIGSALSFINSSYAQIAAVTPWNGALVAAGRIAGVNGQPASGLAVWDGRSWSTFPAGDGSNTTALATIDEHLIASPNPANPLYGGAGQWDGTQWVAMSNGLMSYATAAFASAGQELFTVWGVISSSNLPAPVFRWSGSSWSRLSNQPFSGTSNSYGVLAAYGGDLYLGGSFQNVAGSSFNNVARWDGATWQPPGGGVSGGFYPEVDALLAFHGELIAAGRFNSPGPGIARWNASDWLTIPEAAGGMGTRLAEYDGQLIIARNQSAGAVTFPALARWDPGAPTCYANCDCSTSPPVLNVSDFHCFMSHFAAGDPSANCDNSTSPPILNVSDFVCFMQRFAQGCTAP